jgi:hypothetical protein
LIAVAQKGNKRSQWDWKFLYVVTGENPWTVVGVHKKIRILFWFHSERELRLAVTAVRD